MKNYEKKMDAGVFFDEDQDETMGDYMKSLSSGQIRQIIDDGIRLEILYN